jgi:hypothetical protein
VPLLFISQQALGQLYVLPDIAIVNDKARATYSKYTSDD